MDQLPPEGESFCSSPRQQRIIINFRGRQSWLSAVFMGPSFMCIRLQVFGIVYGSKDPQFFIDICLFSAFFSPHNLMLLSFPIKFRSYISLKRGADLST